MSEACDIVEFGPFRLDAARRQLSRDGQPVVLSSRAFDILSLLVEHRDRVMTKDEIITHVWRGLAVEENNLAVQVSALRRALAESELGAPLILTVPGQGYRFVGRISPARQVVPDAAAAPDAIADVVTIAPPSAALPSAAPRDSGRTWRAAWPAAAGIALAGLAALATAYVWLQPAPPAPAIPAAAPPRLSIAVLPFRDLSDDRCCAYLADAVSDDLTTDLSHIPGSLVIARESSDVYRNKSLPTADIGRALNVRYLLEGSLRAVEGNFSINAQLIEAATGFHLWAEHFTVPRNHLGDAQEAVVHRLASALGVTLIQIEGSASAREHRSDPDALDLFFQARSMLERSETLSSMNQAQRLLEQALATQPDFADALAELAFLLSHKVSTVTDPNYTADLQEARRLTARALIAAPNSGLALAARGSMLALDGHLPMARATLEAALAQEPESVPIRTALISCLGRLGEYELEIGAVQELLRIDPEGPETRRQYYNLGVASIMLDRPRDGLEWLTRATSGAPEPEPGADELGFAEYASLYRVAALQQLGDTGAAQTELARYTRIWPNRTAWQIGASFTRAQTSRPGYAKFISALTAAGLRAHFGERDDFGVAPVDRPTEHRAFDPTPTSIHRAGLIDTDGVHKRLEAGPAPRIINLGSGAVTLDHTIADCSFDWGVAREVQACASFLLHGGGGGPVIVMGLGVTDWNGYNSALALANAGVPNVLWYRGGEESWANSGGSFRDARP